jgi:hypothetical protein
METIIKEIPVTEIEAGDQIFQSMRAINTTDNGFWITAVEVEISGDYVDVGWVDGDLPSNSRLKIKHYDFQGGYSDGFVFVKRQG